MGYEDVQELHEKELLAMGISRDEAKEIMAAEEEYGVSFREMNWLSSSRRETTREEYIIASILRENGAITTITT